jgi:hypothetical protein
MMKAIRRAVVAALLAVWCFPAVSLAKSAPAEPAPVSAPAPISAAVTSETGGSETESLATREQKAPELQDFKGGAVIIAGGATVVLLVLLIVLLV